MVTNYIDEQILYLRNEQNSRIKTILAWVVKECPMVDEIVCLARVVNILKEDDQKIIRSEVKDALDNYYHKKFHGDIVSYLNWLIEKPHPSKKTPFPLVEKNKLSSLLHDNPKVREIPLKIKHAQNTRGNNENSSPERCLKPITAITAEGGKN